LDVKKAILEFLVATLPVAVVYLLGWSYLYNFLGSFGIDMGETHFDTSTIFVYSFTPLQIFVKVWWACILWVAIGALVLGFLLARFLPNAWNASFQQLRGRILQASIGAKISVLILGLLVFALLILVPVARWAAFEERAQIWMGKGFNIIALLKEGAKSREAQGGSKPPETKDPPSRWLQSYVECSEQEALQVIFSDDKAYYLLCKSVRNANEGYVFEVRRELGLMSVRFVSAGGAP